MNRTDKECGTEEGEASSASSGSRPTEGSSLDLELSHSPTSRPSSQSVKLSEEAERMKRAAVKKIIERYFYQLTDGCGNPSCSNQYCASSGMLVNLTPDQAAAQAIHLFSTEAQLCDAQPKKVARTQSDVSVKNNENGRSLGDSGSRLGSNSSSTVTAMDVQEECPKSSQSPTSTASSAQGKAVPFLTEEKLLNILEVCKNEGSYSLLIRTLGEVYSSVDSLSLSFLKQHPDSPIDAMLDKAPKDLKNIKKEDVRMMEGDMDKDEDSLETGECSLGSGEKERKAYKSSSDINVDILSLRRAYKALFELPSCSQIESPFVHALMTLAGCIEFDLRVYGGSRRENLDDLLNVFVIILEIPMLGMSEYLELALPKICKAAAQLPIAYQAKLARVWAKHSRHQLTTLVQSLQQLITLKVISGHFTREYCIQEEETITEPTKLMKVAYYASLLAGELDPPELRHEDMTAYIDEVFGGAVGIAKIPKQTIHEDPLGTELGIHVLDSRKPLLPFTDFYNDPLSDAIEMDKDFANYKHEPLTAQTRKFSFMNYSFILTPATKTLGLYYDNRIRMYSERRLSFFHQVIGQPTSPYLKVRVKRDDLISDALVELEMIAMESPKDLKKQLVVEFDGEQGIDEGGVSKEFFQLIVEELFNPDYGMFVHQQETETVWFNPTSFESDAQFTLIGIILGLAIYNNVILDIHFPMVIYRKLLGKKGTFHDLEDWNVTLYTGLQTMLSYELDDMEETFVQTFRICYKDVFGTTFFHELKEGGDQIFVNQDNKLEFVDLYADFLLNTSVEKQFRAFRRGFHMVTDESPLTLLFRPEEVEQLVCGSKNFDFNELEDATEYDGGYTAESEIIKFFWEIVHNLPLEFKRKLLQFATGSDRVPVGGLSKLKLIIARNGPDSDRLPTAHTCFNVLLLPEYDSKEKLNDRLMKAISYSKGFGML